MKTKSCSLALAILTFAITFTQGVTALTFAELAGTYVGKRTETLPEGVRRYDEIVVIEAEGTLSNYVFLDGELIYVTSGSLEILAEGDYWLDFGYGIITLRGAHLDVTAGFPELGATVHFQGRRTKRPPERP